MRLERNEAKKLISEFVGRYKALLVEAERAYAVFNCADCDLFDAIWSVVYHEVGLIDRLTNDGEWLYWFVGETRCSKFSAAVTRPGRDGKLEARTIKTVDDILWVMGYDDE